MPFDLPSRFAAFVLHRYDAELSALILDAPMPYLDRDDRRVPATDDQAARLYEAAITMLAIARNDNNRYAARKALQELSFYAPPADARECTCRQAGPGADLWWYPLHRPSCGVWPARATTTGGGTPPEPQCPSCHDYGTIELYDRSTDGITGRRPCPDQACQQRRRERAAVVESERRARVAREAATSDDCPF